MATARDDMAQLRQRVRELRKLVSTPSYDTLESQANRLGRRLPTSTISDLLNGPRRARWKTVESFVLACQAYAHQRKLNVPVERFDLVEWTAAYERMSGTAVAATVSAGETERSDPYGALLPGLPATPHLLPAAPRWFVGRDRELDTLTAVLDTGSAPSRTVVTCLIQGMGGIGKTALALHWAHSNIDRFPDGQLYVNLRGFDPSGELMPPAVAVRGFLDALGVEAERVPPTLDAQAALYRSLVAGRRMLIVLDNARDSSRIEPLLPGSPSCLVLVTSRSQLAALQLRGAELIDLGVLTRVEARQLLGQRLGGKRIAAEPGATSDLIRCCAGVPLAISIVAARAVQHPAFPLSALAEELRDVSRRLDALDAGDPQASLRAVFSWSYGVLDAEAASIFRLLGIAPGPDISLDGITKLAATTTARAHRLTASLERAYLVQQLVPDRYRMHDLVRLYAAERADEEDSEHYRRDALTRLFDHYLGTAAAAIYAAFPAERDRLARSRVSLNTSKTFSSADAVTWLKTERPNLTTTSGYTAQNGWPRHTKFIASTIRGFLDTNAYYADALEVHGNALKAAQSQGDRVGEVLALNNLGTVYWQLGLYEEAYSHLNRALGLRRELGDHAGEANTLDNLAGVYWGQGRYTEALEHFQTALVLNRESGDRPSEGRTHNNIGVLCVSLGRYNEAVDHLEQAFDIAQEMGDHPGFGALNNLGIAYERLGRYTDALNVLEQALSICRESGYRAGEAATLDSLGVVYMRLGQHQTSIDYHRQAIALAREISDRSLEAEMLNNLGDTLRSAGRHDDALANHQSALALSTEIGNSHQKAHALDGIAQILKRLGRTPDARRYWLQALTIYAQLGVPEAAAVQDQLTELDSSD